MLSFDFDLIPALYLFLVRDWVYDRDDLICCHFIASSYLIFSSTLFQTGQPSRLPSCQPSAQPVMHPSTQPSKQPSGRPSMHPSAQPTRQPTEQPTRQPTRQPTGQPTRQPSSRPSRQPTSQPTRQPSCQPSSKPTSPTGTTHSQFCSTSAASHLYWIIHTLISDFVWKSLHQVNLHDNQQNFLVNNPLNNLPASPRSLQVNRHVFQQSPVDNHRHNPPILQDNLRVNQVLTQLQPLHWTFVQVFRLSSKWQ